MASRKRLGSPEQYNVAWIAALPHERAAATAILDEEHDKPTAFEQLPHDTNAYTWGKVGDHHVVIASLPAGQYGTTIAATTANALRFSLPHIRFGLMVGIGAGVPQLERGEDVRLGDIVVSQPHESSGGVIQYDLVKARQDGHFLTGYLAMPPEVLLKSLGKLQAEHEMRDSTVPSILKATLLKFPKMAKRTAKDPGYAYPGAESDRLFAAPSHHSSGPDCSACPEADVVPRDQRDTTDPEIHYGVIASGNTLVKNAHEREEILKRLPQNLRSKCLCIEMEAAGLMNTFPCIVIRGICDYADSHKNDRWQKYAAATAAAFAKEFLGFVDAHEVKKAPELREAAEQDRYKVPFSLRGIPLKKFIGRDAQLHQIEQQLQPESTKKSGRKVFVVRGLGGIGKTKLAARYAQIHQDKYSAIFWMDGSTKDRLKQSFLEAAKRIPGEQLQVDVAATLESEKVDVEVVMRGVLQWLSLPKNWKWLLVIDNVDREFRGPAKDEHGFDPGEAMPVSDHGSILITSRLWGLKGTDKDLHLGHVSESEAEEILVYHADRPLQDIHLLVGKLNGLPLALAQAGSFIGMTNCDVQKYIYHFGRTWSDLMQKQDQFSLQEYGERSMLTTWKLSYDQVLRQSETAAWLLRLWAFFYHDDLWYGLLAKSGIAPNAEEFEEFEQPTWLSGLTASELEFSSAMALLKAYSLADSKDLGSYTMHPVLHQWSRSLSMDTDAVSLLSVSANVLGSAVSLRYDVEAWELDRRLLQHVLHASNEWRMAQPPVQQKRPSRLTHHLNLVLHRQGKLHEAEWMLQLTLTSEEKALGPNHKLTLETLSDLGQLYSTQGKLDEAEQMLERALSGKEEAFGSDHTSTLGTVLGIGALYIKQGKLDKAEQIHLRSLTSCEKVVGPDHRLTLGTLNNLGNIYHLQGRLDESEQMYKRTVTGFEKAHGEGPLFVSLLRPVFNLGFLYYRSGRLDESEKMYERALAGYQEIHGRSHPEAIGAAECLAVVRSEKAAREAESRSEAAFATDEHSVVPTRKRKRSEQETAITLRQIPDPPRP